MSTVEVRKGNIFDSSASTLVNTVNCVGVMGKGLARQFRDRFPAMYEDYVQRCARHEVALGYPYLYQGLLPPAVLNFPTKDHWRSVARLDDIVTGLRYLRAHYRAWGIDSIAVPPLGCGEGRLDWQMVGPTLYRHLTQLDIPVELYAPSEAPDEWLSQSFLNRASQSGITMAGPPVEHAASVQLGGITLATVLDRIEQEPYRWPVGRTIFQKLAYFATTAGLPTGLQFTKGTYGPYSSELGALMSRLVNNGLIIEQRRGRMFTLRPGPTYEDAASLHQSALEELRPRIERVADLFLRLRDTRQAEMVASVHFIAAGWKHRPSGLPSEREVFEAVQQWKARHKPPPSAQELALAVRGLAALGWVDVRPSTGLPLPDDTALDVS